MIVESRRAKANGIPLEEKEFHHTFPRSQPSYSAHISSPVSIINDRKPLFIGQRGRTKISLYLSETLEQACTSLPNMVDPGLFECSLQFDPGWKWKKHWNMEWEFWWPFDNGSAKRGKFRTKYAAMESSPGKQTMRQFNGKHTDPWWSGCSRRRISPRTVAYGAPRRMTFLRSRLPQHWAVLDLLAAWLMILHAVRP